MKEKVRGSFASYMPTKKSSDGETDLDELAQILLDWGRIPKTLNDTKAYELMLLASEFQRLRKLYFQPNLEQGRE